MGLPRFALTGSHIGFANRLTFFDVIRVFFEIARRDNRSRERVCIETAFRCDIEVQCRELPYN